MRTKDFYLKLDPPKGTCSCGKSPCVRNVIVARWLKTGRNKFGWVPLKKNGRWVCQDCYDVELGEICKKHLTPLHEGYGR